MRDLLKFSHCVWVLALFLNVIVQSAEASSKSMEKGKGQAQAVRLGEAGESAMRLQYEKIFDRGATPADVIAKPLARALEVLLEPSQELESPMGNVRSLIPVAGKSQGPDDKEGLKATRERLIDYFNREGTELVLLEEGKEGRGFAPERGEDLKKNWVFSLTIPSLSDHIYWIVVAKDSSEKAYVYGFN